MADIKISDLPAASSVTGGNLLEISQGSGPYTSYKATAADIANTATNVRTVATGGTGVTTSTGTGSVVRNTAPSMNAMLTSNYQDFTSTAAPAYQEGRLWYDTDQKALSYYNDVTNNILTVGQEIQIKVRNGTGSTLPNGAAVYATSVASGFTYPNVALAQANSLATSSVLGLVDGAIAPGAVGYVSTHGLITGVPTGTFTVGDVLYLSPYSAGILMNTRPPTGYAIMIGMCFYSNSPNGTIYIKQTTPLAVSADTLVGAVPVANGGTGVATLTSGYLMKGAGTSAVAASVIYDDGSNIGIGTATPAAGTILDVQSTTKGVRFPNMTTAQKNAMTGAAGAVVFDTTLGKLCVYSGSAWQTITSA